MKRLSQYPKVYQYKIWNISDVEYHLFKAAQTLKKLPTSSWLKEPKDRAVWWPKYQVDELKMKIITLDVMAEDIDMMDIVLGDWMSLLDIETRSIVWFRVRNGRPMAWRKIAAEQGRSHENCRARWHVALEHLANSLNLLPY